MQDSFGHHLHKLSGRKPGGNQILFGVWCWPAGLLRAVRDGEPGKCQILRRLWMETLRRSYLRTPATDSLILRPCRFDPSLDAVRPGRFSRAVADVSSGLPRSDLRIARSDRPVSRRWSPGLLL